MKTIVRFRTTNGEYALLVEDVTEVRSATELTPLPAPRAGVAGLMTHGEEALTVLSVLSEAGGHVIVIDAGAMTFGLLVDEVTGVQRVEDALVGPPPSGQDSGAVSGVIIEEDSLVLLLDSAALQGRLST